ncbi:hypothetical protein BDV3_002902 [Batrachochytrium dendrobatidis]
MSVAISTLEKTNKGYQSIIASLFCRFLTLSTPKIPFHPTSIAFRITDNCHPVFSIIRVFITAVRKPNPSLTSQQF